MGERSGAPSGFSPASIVISKPPVAVQLPQPDVSANRDAPQQKFVKDANTILPFRNDITHNMPTQVIILHGMLGEPTETTPPLPLPPVKQWWEIRTEPTKLLRKKERDSTATAEDIDAHIGSVNQLLKDMWELRADPS